MQSGWSVYAAVRSRHRFDYLDETYSLVEAMLWLGIYLAINLTAFVVGPARAVVGRHCRTPLGLFARPFYWATWVLIWCLPPIVLARGIRQKDRFVIAVGAIVAVLTLVSNKPYLGWPRHTWDPMLLGILLTGVAVFLRRWLAAWPGRNSPRLYRSATVGKGQTVDECGVDRLGAGYHRSRQARNQPAGLPLWRRRFGRRRRERRFLKGTLPMLPGL